MPEYRRFIAYFYEYINGKKQKSAGFAKVELRNGMWRILFRLTTDVVPEEPIQVYGFVREQEYLLGFPMGVMRAGKEIVEEWAYRAELPIGKEKYRLADFSGIWIQSGDGRCFATVWDDEGVNPEKFVLELPKDDGNESPEQEYVLEEEETPAQEEVYTLKEKETSAQEEAYTLKEEETPAQEEAYTLKEKETSAQEEVYTLKEEETPAQEEAYTLKEEETPAQEEAYTPEEEETPAQEEAYMPEELEKQVYVQAEEVDGKAKGLTDENELEHLFKKRNLFQPFQDEEITGCVQILPCDIAWLQQKDWKVGRSSFLQHGFYQYRHLLLGKMADGTCVIGVPGIRNPQEKYMAELFGYDRFKMSKLCECGRTFGYWYRPLIKKNGQ